MRVAALLTAAIAALSAPGTASAQVYRLRADAFFAAADPTVGLLMLTSEARKASWLEAEAVAWVGSGDRTGSVLVASVRARDPGGLGEVRGGRILVSPGAIRPVHLDGADAIARLPSGTSFEVFGGLPIGLGGQSAVLAAAGKTPAPPAPIAPENGPRGFDWAAGQRVGQRLGDVASAGLSFLELRQGGSVAYREIGVDAAVTTQSIGGTRGGRAPIAVDGAFAGAFDLAQPGLADARLSIAARFSSLRLEAFAVRRAPSHLLPATSLFSALSDVPSERVGGTLSWHAAPRLDLLGEGSVERLGAELGGRLSLRATLRLDDAGDGALGVTVQRQGTPGASWTGVRGTARLPITRMLAAAAEAEIAAPDDPAGRGAVWPWALVALRLRTERRWELAAALEASASPTNLADVSALLRVTRVWEIR
jgi:hypothetical protein